MCSCLANTHSLGLVLEVHGFGVKHQPAGITHTMHLCCMDVVECAGSDAGLSQQSEERSLEETLSLRSHNVGFQGGGGGGGSITSSTWAELGAQVRTFW